MDIDKAKQAVGRAAAGHVRSGMRVGLGTGSTVRHTILELGRRVREEGLDIEAVPTSQATAALAAAQGIALVELDDRGLELAIDGADAFDPELNLVKGGGGALLREKVVAQAAERFIVVCDSRKQVPVLGDFPLPVEVVPFGWRHTAARLGRALGGRAVLRRRAGLPAVSLGGVAVERSGRGGPVVTDNANLILDLHTGPTLHDPAGVEASLHGVAGVVATGLFVGQCELVLVGGHDGVRAVRRPSRGAME